MDILLEDDLEKALEFAKECAIKDAQQMYGYIRDWPKDMRPSLETEAEYGVLEYNKMLYSCRPNGDLYEGERKAYLKAFKEAWNNCLVKGASKDKR